MDKTVETLVQPGKFVNPAEVVHLLDLEEGMRLADFGSGSGAYVLAAAPMVGKTGKVLALDIQKELLTKLKTQSLSDGYTNITFLWGSFEGVGSTGIETGSLDRVLISNTLFQLADKQGAIAEAKRVLDGDGKLFLIDWTESFKGMGPKDGEVVSKSNAKELAQKAGFILEKEFEPGAHHYGLVFKK